MLELVTLVKLGIVPLVRLPPAQRDVVLPQDLQPALPQAAEGTGVALTFVAFLLVISLRPRTFGPTVPAEVSPQVNRVTQDFVARPPTVPKLCPKRTFSSDLLGFTHYWSLSRKGHWVVKRKTAKSRPTRPYGWRPTVPTGVGFASINRSRNNTGR